MKYIFKLIKNLVLVVYISVFMFAISNCAEEKSVNKKTQSTADVANEKETASIQSLDQQKAELQSKIDVLDQIIAADIAPTFINKIIDAVMENCSVNILGPSADCELNVGVEKEFNIPKLDVPVKIEITLTDATEVAVVTDETDASAAKITLDLKLNVSVSSSAFNGGKGVTFSGTFMGSGTISKTSQLIEIEKGSFELKLPTGGSNAFSFSQDFIDREEKTLVIFRNVAEEKNAEEATQQ
ncbi:hypothetical protein WDW89_18930 [Deltaproteobacteria bacterium TL4]